MCRMVVYKNGDVELQGCLVDSVLDFRLNTEFLVLNGMWKGRVEYSDGNYYMHVLDTNSMTKMNPKSEIGLIVIYSDFPGGVKPHNTEEDDTSIPF